MSNFFSNKTLLVPFDFSDAAVAAVDEARDMGDESTRVSVLHVLLPLYVIAIEPGTVVDLGGDDDRVQDAIDGMKKRISDPGLSINFAARIGDPGTKIVDYAKEIGADLIVMPSHGRTGLKHLLLGSVAERVVRLAECPVMVQRTPKAR